MFLSDEETLAAGIESGVIDCDKCAVARYLDELDPCNQDAWMRYQRLTGHQLIWDAHAGDWWLKHIVRDLDPDDVDDMVARMDVLYKTFHPPKQGS